MIKNGYSMPRCGTAAVALMVCAAAAGLAAPLPAQAGKVGVAAAVNPDAFSSLSGVPNKQLNIGKSIFYNERIETTTSGLVQVLLVDGSTFTVGPNSNLVIDKFVYDPNKKTGEMVATFSKGSMRFIGGKLSKNAGGVQVNTPSGALAIRGGMFQGNTQKKIYSFLYGHSLTFRGRNGQTQTIFQPGYTLDLSHGGANVRPTTPEDTAIFARALTNRGGSSSASNGSGGDGTQGGDHQASGSDGSGALTQTVSLQSLISDATSTQITDEIDKQIEEQKNSTPTSTPNNTPTNTPTTNPTPPKTNLTPTETPPRTIDARVIHTGPDGLLTDDLVWTFTVKGNRLLADIPAEADIDAELETVYLRSGPAAKIDFPEKLTCLNGFCSVETAKVTADGETTNFIGHAVLKNDFFAYHVVSDEPNDFDRLLVFGGKKHNFGEPAGKIYLFALTSDIVQGDAPPFASGGSAALGEGNAFVSPLIAKEQNGGAEDQSRPVWLQTSFALGSGDSEGQSFVNIALGEWSSEGGLTGARRGGADLDSDNYSFSGDIASLEGPDGGHFLGADGETPNAVLTLGGPGTENLGRDTPLHGNEVLLQIDNSDLPNGVQDGPGIGPSPAIDAQSGSTYHIAVGTETLEGVEAGSGTFTGYAAGFSQQAGSNELRSLVNSSPNDVKLELDGDTNNLTATIKVADGRLLPNPRYEFKFGGQGNSALIDNDIFAAFEKPGKSTIEETVLVTRTETIKFGPFEKTITHEWPENKIYRPDTQGYFASADAIGANEVLFPKNSPNDVQKKAFCQDCDYIKWGAWGMRSNYTDHQGNQVAEDTHLGWWIAGDVVSSADMPTTGTASYTGDAIGTVAKLKDGVWNQSVATGNMRMDWNFATRGLSPNDKLTISNFDGKTFSGRMYAPGKASFGGALSGAGGIRGSAAGSFVGSPGKGQIPGGVIGNFDVQKANGKWMANGIYGGTRIPR
ncbi:MAG: FecR domain-containing protein [Methyloceanibacter sp.]|uniref:FecR domain-containing protein n=1 Tax=Methyloceanibacter sp. TaxID=1965321 RepID=UPI001D815680|nr:FecR domain-containing protein [Methyloceanibacter sp.]MCB1444075.1 FecR domain-containing protein [Methyloceanibacter sp.]